MVVVGGGAAGFFAAINCATHHRELSIAILEAAKQPLGKVKISGGGRCNVTHYCFNPRELAGYYPRGGKELIGAFSRFQPRDTIQWFESRGVQLKTEADGRVFPVTDDSQTIIDCLVTTARQLGVKIYTQTPVVDIRRGGGGFEIVTKGETIFAERVLIATGSSPLGYKWASNLGHRIEKPIPSLFTFRISDRRLADLAGITCENVTLTLRVREGRHKKLETSGALLITHWGISGPATLKLSAWGARILHDANYCLPLTINWLPSWDEEGVRRRLYECKQTIPRQKVTNYHGFPLARRLWQSLALHILTKEDKTWAEITRREMELLTKELLRGEYHIEGRGVFKEEFVTCGGVSLKEVDFRTMMSKICPNLFFAGEILDIDGLTGGFNLQNAWTTGWIAGLGLAARRLL